MKPVIRYRSQLLFRQSYRPDRISRQIAAPKLVFKPARRAGFKPQITLVS